MIMIMTCSIAFVHLYIGSLVHKANTEIGSIYIYHEYY